MHDLLRVRTLARRTARSNGRPAGGPANDMMRAVAQRLTRERAVRGLSIEELAEQAGISTGLLSQLERGIGNPSLNTLQGLANALEMPLTTFFHVRSSDRDMVVRAAKRKRIVLSDRNMVYEMLVPNLERNLFVVHIQLPPEFSNEQLPYSHPGEECNTLLQGRMEAHVGESVWLLEPGDSITIDAATPHWFRTFDECAVVICAMTPPSP